MNVLISPSARVRDGDRAVLLVGLDGLPDGVGHAERDAMRAEAARRLRRVIGEAGEAVPLPGAEFVVVLADSGKTIDPALVAENIAGELARPYPVDGRDLHAHPRVRVGAFPADGAAQKEALARKLRESHAKLSAIMDTIPDMVWLKDQNGVYLACNRQLERFLGATEAEIVGKTDYDFFDVALADFFRQKDVEAMAAGVACINEENVACAEGGCRGMFETRKVPVYGEGGQVIGVMGIARDVTALRESEMRLSRLAANLPGFVFSASISRAGVAALSFASPGIREVFGVSPEEAENDISVLVGCVPVSERMRVSHLVSDAVFSWRPICTELRVDHPGKGLIWVELRAMPEPDANGGALLHGIVTDVTGRKQIEDLLYRREQEFRALAENSPDIIVRYDLLCRRIYINPAYEVMSGIPPAELLGQVPREGTVLAATEAARLLGLVREVVRTGANGEIELMLVNGKCYQLRAVPEFASTGGIQSVLTVARDITDLKETEERLAQSRARLRELAARRELEWENERKRVSREMHEDVGQCLTMLGMGIGSLRMRLGAGAPDLEPLVSVMEASVKQAIATIRVIMAALRPPVLEIGLLQAVERLAAEFTRCGGVPCTLSLAEEASGALDEARAIVVYRVVEEALSNITRHARARNVGIVMQWRDGMFVEIRDDGLGFDLDLPVSNSLGIFAMQERVAALGGEMVIFSAPARGTVIEVLFPDGPV